METILLGVVGSTAYGLNRAGSDVDRLGIFAAPTLQVSGLDWGPSNESIVRHEPSDVTMHEVRKFCGLALKCNPTVTELLWLDAYEEATELGSQLTYCELRTGFLSDRYVKDSYGGYAYAQYKRLESSEDGTFSADVRKRTVKHARHMLRLLRQGKELRETGSLTVRVDNPQEYFDFDDMTTEQMIAVFRRETKDWDNTTTVLPKKPDRERVVDWLQDVRRLYM